MEKKKKIIYLMLFVIMTAGIFSLTRFPVTYAYFSDQSDTDTSLTYKAQLYNLYHKNSMVLTKATFDDAKLRFTFETNKTVTEEEIDRYTVTLPTACKFEQITTAGTVENGSEQVRVITYASGKKKNDKVTVNISCAIRVNKDLKFDAIVTENVESNKTGKPVTSPSFVYQEMNYSETYKNYVKHINQVEDSSTAVGANLYDKLIEAVKSYGQKLGLQADILQQTVDYVNTVFKDDTSVKNTNNFNILPGLSITHNQETGEYTYNILDNFVGYARTYTHYKNALATTSVIFYFSTNSRNALYQALVNYLDRYVYPNDQFKSNLVYEYAYNNDIIASLINGNFVAGWTLTIDKNNAGNTYVRFTKGFIESDAMSAKEKAPYVAYDTTRNMTYKYKELVRKYYPDIPANIQTEIFNRADINESVMKNNSTVADKTSFKDYFIHQNGDQYLLIKISSDTNNLPGFNRVEITPLTVPAGMTISFNNTTSEVTVQISAATESSVMNTVSELNGYFDASITKNDVTVLTTSPYSIEYKITK